MAVWSADGMTTPVDNKAAVRRHLEEGVTAKRADV